MPGNLAVNHDDPTAPVLSKDSMGQWRPTRTKEENGKRFALDLITRKWEDLTPPSFTEDVIRGTGPALIRGAGALIGTPGALADIGATAIDAAARTLGPRLGITPEPYKRKTMAEGGLPTPEELIKQYEEQSGSELYKPRTVPGKIYGAAVEGVPGAIAGPFRGATPARAALDLGGNILRYGVLPGAAGEVAGEATQGSPFEGPARLGAALATGGIAGAAAQPDFTARTIRRNLPQGVSVEMVDQAEGLIGEARRMGIQLTWPEALSQVAGRPIGTDLLRHLEAAPQTAPRMADFFAGRVPAITAQATRQLGEITPPPANPYTIGPRIGEAAGYQVGEARREINARTNALYASSENTPLSPQQFSELQAMPGYAEARDRIRNTPQLNRFVADLPDNSVGFADAVKQQLAGRERATSDVLNVNRNALESSGYATDAATARRLATEASTIHENALLQQEELRRQYLQPLLQGPLGRLANDSLETRQAINVLFPREPLAHGAQQVGDAVRRVAQRDPEAARELVRTHIEMTFNQAARELQTGQNPALGAKFRVMLVGGPQQQANLEAAVRALPNGDQVWPGFERFLDIMQATGTRQGKGSLTSYNQQFFNELAQGGFFGEALRGAVGSPLAPANRLIDKWQQWGLGQNLDELARVLTEPRSANLLRRIAVMPRDSSRTLALAWRAAQIGEGQAAHQVGTQ